MSKQVKIPRVQYVIFNKTYNQYVSKYSGINKYIQNAKLYKTYEAAKDAIKQKIAHDTWNNKNPLEYEIQDIEVDLVSASEWKHEEYITSRRCNNE